MGHRVLLQRFLAVFAQIHGYVFRIFVECFDAVRAAEPVHFTFIRNGLALRHFIARDGTHRVERLITFFLRRFRHKHARTEQEHDGDNEMLHMHFLLYQLDAEPPDSVPSVIIH
jgi:hypothetical protein